jgi:branched-chain amino acid transport system permease protein
VTAVPGTIIRRGTAALAAAVTTGVVFWLLAGPLGLNAFFAVAVGYVLGTLASLLVLPDWNWAGMWPAAGVAIIAPVYLPAYDMAQIALLAIISIGTIILTGFAGQISIAQGAFVGVGAYTTALLEIHYHWPFYATIVPAVVVSAFLGLIIAVPSARLAGIFQVMTTLALAVAFPILIEYWGSYTGGDQGVNVSRLVEPQFLGHIVTLSQDQYVYFVILIALLIALWAARNVLRGHPGRAFRAMRDNEIVAETMGVHLTREKIIAFVLSAAWAGLGGSLYSITLGVISPGTFTLFFSIQFLVITVVGGMSSLPGAVVGAAIIWELGLKVNEITVPGFNVELSSQVLYGVILVLILLLMPRGVVGALNRLAATRPANRLLTISDVVSTRFGRTHRVTDAPPVEAPPSHASADNPLLGGVTERDSRR